MVKQVAENGKSPAVLSAHQNILNSTQHRFPMLLDFGMKQIGCLGENPLFFFLFFLYTVMCTRPALAYTEFREI